jgi:hypothetical protein
LVCQIVTFRVEFHASALAQLQTPTSAFDALVDRVSKLVGAPWETQTLDPHEPSSGNAPSVTSDCCPSTSTTTANSSESST